MLAQFNSKAILYVAWHWCVLMDPANHLKDGLKVYKMVHDPLMDPANHLKDGLKVYKMVHDPILLTI